MTKVLLHIGAPKCGSTYLQRVLLQNQAKLRDAGFHYPHQGVGHPGNGRAVISFDDQWLRAATKNADWLLLSHEDLFAQPAVARRFRAETRARGMEVQIVVFLRPFSEILFGDLSQQLKQYPFDSKAPPTPLGGRDFRQYVWARHKDFAADLYLDAWADLFDERPLKVASHREITSCLTELLPGLPSLDLAVEPGSANPSFPPQRCEEAIALIEDGEVPETVRRHLSQGHSGHLDRARTGRRVDWIEQVFATRNARLLQQFGYDNRAKAS